MQNSYQCLSKQSFEYNKYFIKTVQRGHIESIRLWRNAQMNVLRQKKTITKNDQILYFEEYIWPTLDLPEPNQILFSFFNENSFIGYGGLVHISWQNKRAEISFLLNPNRIKNPEDYAVDFKSFLSLIKIVAFEELRFNKIFTETYDIRDQHISILEQSGFLLEGRLKQHVIIENNKIDSLIHGYLRDYDL